ncbi:thiopeptide-type bacteriocin biosynthesis protein [Chryseobacterium cucumeris]|uniref:thiopeptide-type bacteriocin biosynthesis protein n=1 Tax=Chryseobacterium cucumeris TaxID=1813611 RepID=UPI000AF47B9E|nr:thiopeptide-type bacteriocin biosynthesis protein [Chryseobacterium cucumeris]
MDKLIERTNIIGGEWIYYKIYSGVENADEIIRIVNEVALKLFDLEVLELWFFIRYADPKQHLRIRFKCKNSEAVGSIISEMHKALNPLVSKDLIWKVQLDTYNREVERYGKNTIEYSEILFYYDSIMVVDYLNNFNDENLRWMFSLIAIDNHLDIFNYNLNEKYNLLNSLSTGFKNEFIQSKTLNQGLNDRYRLYRKDIESVMNKTNEYSLFYSILENKKRSLKKISDYIISLKEKNNLEVDFDELNSSYIHMMMNRLFSMENRKFEMVCYEFLNRYYKSKIAQQKLFKENS